MANKQNRQNAQQTFRQFAWNLAGTLARPKPVVSRPGKR
jgi:hypothetical protein